MKHLTLLLLSTFLFIGLMAQENTLIKSKVKTGAYGGPIFKTGQINGGNSIFIGGQGGVVLNHKLVLGAKGYASLKPIGVDGLQNIVIGFATGGAFIEYIFAPSNLVNFSIDNMIGYGIGYNDVGKYNETHDPIDYTGDACLVIEPGLNVNINVTKMVKIGFGVSYRIVSGLDFDPGAPYQFANGENYDRLTDKDLTGLSAQIAIKIGLF